METEIESALGIALWEMFGLWCQWLLGQARGYFRGEGETGGE
jgi:hypothetical protein